MLSICIPTFNRASSLDRLLSNISEEATGLGEGIEVCISDNGSKDNTQAVISKWEKQMPISKNRNSANRGFDVNVIMALRLAKGRFAWLMGDDDALVEGAVGRLLQNLKKHGNSGLGAVYLRNYPKNPGDLKKVGFAGFRIFGKGERGCPHLPVGFISSNCLRRDIAMGVVRKKVRVLGNRLSKDCPDPSVLHGCINTYLFLECVRVSGKFGVDSEPAVSFRGDGSPVSANKKMLFDLWIYEQYYDIHKHYPWWKNSLMSSDFPLAFFLKHSIVRAIFAQQIPGLAPAFETSQKLYGRVLLMEGKHGHVLFLKIFGTLMGIPFAGRAAYAAYAAYKAARREENLLEGITETDPVMEKELGAAIARAKLMVAK